MFLLREPSEEIVRNFIRWQAELPFSYPEVGATHPREMNRAPAGYVVDHNRTKLGEGEEAYRRAANALGSWRHFDLGWAEVLPKATMEPGVVVAVKAKAFGLWSLNACRIVYLLGDDSEDPEDPEFKSRFGYAYGTLPDHAECGEERFSVEWRQDDSVWYDIFAFSHPQHPFVKLGVAFARRLQRRFAKESLAAMKRCCARPAKATESSES